MQNTLDKEMTTKSKFPLRWRRGTTSGHTSEHQMKQNDDYSIMKQQLIEKPNRLKVKEHFTERDVHNEFDIKKNGNSLDHLHHMKRTAKKIRRVGNCHWWRTLFFKSFPILQFIKNYEKSWMLSDLAAGISVGLSAIPMGMSYALLANMPPAHGLYCNLFYPFIYMFFATGRQVCVGTSAIEANMSSEGVSRVVGHDATPEAWLNASIGMSFFVGMIFIVFRVLGLDVMASFLADPVLSGFSTGSAMTIGTSQFKYIFGMKIGRLSTFSTWIYVMTHLRQTNWCCVAIFTTGILLLCFTKFANRKWFQRFPVPGSLVVISLSTLIGFFLKIDEAPHNIKVVGEIRSGVPMPMMFNFDSNLIIPLFLQSLKYSVIYLVIHISIAKTIAQGNDYVLDANQEFLAVGVAGVVGSFFQCYPIATSLSRSSIANVAGAHTPLYGIMNCTIMFLTITVITPLMYYMPMPALASVVVFGVYFMCFFDEAWRLLKLGSLDFLIWLTCCAVTIIWGAVEGVFVSVLLSLLWLLQKSAFPNTAVLGRLPGTMIFRNIERFPMADEIPGCKILRFDASLNFSNANQFEKKCMSVVQLDADMKYNVKTRHGNNDTNEQGKELEGDRGIVPRKHESNQENIFIRVLIIDASSINDMDITALRMLQRLAKRLLDSGRVLLFANWKGPMRDFLDRVHFYNIVPPENCFLSLTDAVQWAEAFYLNESQTPSTTTTEEWTLAAGSTYYSSTPPTTDERLRPSSFHYVTEASNNIKRQWAVVSCDIA